MGDMLVITLREGIEAFLIVAIAAAYLRKTGMKYILLTLLLATPFAAHCQNTSAPSVEATYTVDSRDPGAERALKDLKRHIERRAPKVLAPGQKLSVALVSVYRAGHKSWTPGNDGVRVITDSSPARIDLTFNLHDGSDALIAEGSRALRSPTYFVADRGGDPLRFEKDLLDDWLASEFGPRK